MENLEKKLGNENAKAVRLGNVNKETQYVLKFLGIEAPELIEDVEDNQEVILVDHNESSQTVNNLSNAKILKVVDHHTMNFVAPYQLYYRAEPVGCTATVLYKMYKENDIEIDKTIATLMLSAIASDTLILKSPTTTEDDIKIIKKLEEISGLDINVYGTEMLKAGTDISEFSPEEIINIDCKLFEKGNKKFRIAQVNTADLDSIFKNQSYFEQAISENIQKENLDLYVFAATDIINSNSKIISLGNDAPVVEKAFGVSVDNNTAMLENVVSRKKQILPNILNNLD
jgi:probable manganese-dependent inorganic pyrophosphatase